MAFTYRNKIFILLGLCGALLLAYILTFVFDPENSAARQSLWTALDPKLKDEAQQIELDGEEKVELRRDKGRWFVNFEDALYPARQDKISDMLNTLSQRAAYPVRSRSEAAQEKLLLTGSEARRIRINGEDGAILDLLVGAPDATLKEVYIRLSGSKEIRSGADVFSPLFGSRQSWYDLRLFPEHDAEGLTASSIQRVIAQPPRETPIAANVEDVPDALPTEAFTLVRSGGGWKIENSDEIIDPRSVEAYLRGILNCEANDFTSALRANDPAFTLSSEIAGRLVLETGDGLRRIISIGPSFADKRCAAVSGSPYVYLLMEWQLNQIFEKPLAIK
ncbi:MAG: DUF4340 domain-containing protein [Spirochaetaceae bacterium]|jgi:hypothetical protein|nr:DUF4340 domain-containing protein [Spirochaetaceae bacterium]